MFEGVFQSNIIQEILKLIFRILLKYKNKQRTISVEIFYYLHIQVHSWTYIIFFIVK